jgi:hypothetical protein
VRGPQRTPPRPAPPNPTHRTKLAATKRNIIPILDFLLGLGAQLAYQELSAMAEFLGVAKRICLHLARECSQQAIDHLVGWGNRLLVGVRG